MSEKLKPCPFCGGNAKLNSENNSSLGAWEQTIYTISCKKCPCWIGNQIKDKEEAIEAWNKRTK